MLQMVLLLLLGSPCPCGTGTSWAGQQEPSSLACSSKAGTAQTSLARTVMGRVQIPAAAMQGEQEERKARPLLQECT